MKSFISLYSIILIITKNRYASNILKISAVVVIDGILFCSRILDIIAIEGLCTQLYGNKCIFTLWCVEVYFIFICFTRGNDWNRTIHAPYT